MSYFMTIVFVSMIAAGCLDDTIQMEEPGDFLFVAHKTVEGERAVMEARDYSGSRFGLCYPSQPTA